MGKLTLFNNSGVQIPNSMADLNQQLQGIQDQINGHFEGTVTPGGRHLCRISKIAKLRIHKVSHNYPKIAF